VTLLRDAAALATAIIFTIGFLAAAIGFGVLIGSI
jgi:hypothetical protein